MLAVREPFHPREAAFIRAIARTYRAAYSGLPREVWLVSIALLINRAGTMVFPFFALFLTLERGLTVIQAGRLLSLYGIGATFGSFLGGWLSDRIGSTRTQHLTLLTAGVGYFAFTRAESLTAITIGIFFLSMVAEAFRPAAMAAVAEFSPPDGKVRSFALLRLAANAGMSIGPALGGMLAVHSYDWLFFGDGLTCWLASALLFATLGSGRREKSSADDSTPVKPRSPWTDGPFLGLLVLVFLVACVVFQIFSTLPLYFEREYGLRENSIGLLLGLNAALIVLFEMVLVHWAQRHRRMLVIGVGTFLTCTGLGIMPLGSSMLYLVFTVLVWTLGEMLTLPLMSAVVAERASTGNYGRYMGVYAFAFSAAFAISPGVGTWVFERFGSSALWYGIGALGVPLWALTALLAKPFKRERLAREAAALEESARGAGS